MVTGCFDLLHSGHVAFLKEAAAYGQLYVCIGSDKNVFHLKGRYPINPETERVYMLNALSCVAEARVNKGMGLLDFQEEMSNIQPDFFFVNEDGHTADKEKICREKGIEYIVSKRKPEAGLPIRSTTALRTECIIPYRIDIAGGWLDQPWVSKYYPGPVLTLSIEPGYEFNLRSGMATSTRLKAIELWKTALPKGDPEQLAKLLFSYENPPGTKEVAGSQDAIGIVMPGFNRSDYNGGYWPEKITPCLDPEVLTWLQNHLYLVPLSPRAGSFSVLDETRVNEADARRLSVAAQDAWNAALQRNATAFGDAFRRSFEAQIAMFPLMVDDNIRELIEKHKQQALGWKLSGAGGGGYLVLFSETPVDKAIKIKARG